MKEHVSTQASSLPSTASFCVLDRQERVHRHLLLEASAGTGKTFAIEHIVTRLLIEPRQNQEVLSIENILVVTFTRLAARELKERIRSNLQKSLALLKSGSTSMQDTTPDYLLAVTEQGDQAIRSAKKRIEEALFSFDRAQIFTIHAFCWRMLKNYAIEAGISLDSSSKEDQSLSTAHILRAIRDFLRKGLSPLDYSPQQLKILMGRANNRSEKLQQDLLKQVNRGMPIAAPPPFHVLLSTFQEQMTLITSKLRCAGSQIMDDFYTLAPSYKELRDTSKQIHPDKLEKAHRFASLFDRQAWTAEDFDLLIEDGLFFAEAFDPNQKMAKAKPLPHNSLHVPDLIEMIQKHLKAVIEQARHEAGLFARLARDCQQFILRYQEEQEMFGHNELLVRMQQSLQSDCFKDSIRSQYDAAIVDEFQDTDPIQWDIFSSLFVPDDNSWNGYLHLVGDPKQSIYAFRQADIYTYLAAAQRLGPDSRAILDTNFRSTASLINALNLLFSSVYDLFPLPRKSLALPYHAVKAGRKDTMLCNEPSLHLWTIHHSGKGRNPFTEIEADYLLPAIAKELTSLNKERGISYGKCAILINDRYQAERISDYLKAHDIPVKNQRGKELHKSSVKEDMRDILQGTLHHGNKSAFSTALASRLIGLSHLELEQLEDLDLSLPFIQQFHELKSTLIHHGFARFYDSFMRSKWHADNKTVLERLLEQTDGIAFYREWQDLADLMICEEASKSLLPQGLLAFLDELKELALNEEDRIKAYIDPYEEGVAILTTFLSKGLEYDYVFAPGLMNRTRSLENDLIICEKNQELMLSAAAHESDPSYQRHCQENDSEKMRLLYVALTRAREHLYIPIVTHENPKAIKAGCASPIDLLLAKMGTPAADDQELYQRISTQDGSKLFEMASTFPSLFTVSQLNRQSNAVKVKGPAQALPLHPPQKIYIPKAVSLLQSFTSLSHTKKVESHQESNESLFQEEMIPPHHFYEELKTEHTLPAGNETGILLHTLFEKLAFERIPHRSTAKDLIPMITPFIRNTPFAAWEATIADIIFHSLNVTLNNGFCIADVCPKKMYKEIEFLYPHHNQTEFPEAKPGFLKGVIDLFFEHEEKFYLVDWKSNWLGPSKDFYQTHHLKETMRLHHYDLQAAIYKEACRRYLRLFDDRPFEECFGGIYYLFVRGISPTTGVLYHPLVGNSHLELARQSQIEALRSERGSPSPFGKGDEEDLFGKAAAIPNGNFQLEDGIHVVP